jgi:hypothetical protein
MIYMQLTIMFYRDSHFIYIKYLKNLCLFTIGYILFLHTVMYFNFLWDCIKRLPVICDLFLRVPCKVTYDSLDCILKESIRKIVFFKFVFFWKKYVKCVLTESQQNIRKIDFFFKLLLLTVYEIKIMWNTLRYPYTLYWLISSWKWS